MEIRDHHIGRIATQTPGSDVVDTDVGALIRRLLLFDKVTVESIRLKEIPWLINAVGADGLIELLDSGALEIVCDALTVGQIGQAEGLEASVRRGGLLPLGAYHLAGISIGDRRKFVHDGLQEVHRASILFKTAKRVKMALADRLMAYPEGARDAIVLDTMADVRRNDPIIWDAIRAAVQRDTGRDPGPDPEFRVEELEGEGDFRVWTRLAASGFLTEIEAHRLVERGVLAVAGLNRTFYVMRAFQGVSGFREDEVGLFERKLSFLAGQVDPRPREARFDRVVEIAGLPSLEPMAPNALIDVKALLRLREAQECQEFRAWLRTLDATSDEEIEARMRDLRGLVAGAITSPVGKAIRFLVATAAGLLPGLGLPAGAGMSAADTFLLDRVVGKPGPAAFISQHYKSIFIP